VVLLFISITRPKPATISSFTEFMQNSWAKTSDCHSEIQKKITHNQLKCEDLSVWQNG